ncbi:hypothetical protein [Nonomuraea diastatica]|uniref:hypothetical protein n=1 Tax=Nonomuraea diastatica TaxID=1848329 RepID=UPI001FE73428|nr:hypothetical protein [Nonomuraea diastatica]
MGAGPYYLGGLVPLAYTLGSTELQAKARKWIEAILGGQRADGQFGPERDLDWWPRMVALKVLTQHADATGDERVAPFLRRYFEHQRAALPGRPLSGWGGRGGQRTCCRSCGCTTARATSGWAGAIPITGRRPARWSS